MMLYYLHTHTAGQLKQDGQQAADPHKRGPAPHAPPKPGGESQGAWKLTDAPAATSQLHLCRDDSLEKYTESVLAQEREKH